MAGIKVRRLNLRGAFTGVCWVGDGEPRWEGAECTFVGLDVIEGRL
jgi:hypothetical protein